ncbi:MAG: hypothetical protein ACE366_30375 [Bradymonadia bacterium]
MLWALVALAACEDTPRAADLSNNADGGVGGQGGAGGEGDPGDEAQACMCPPSENECLVVQCDVEGACVMAHALDGICCEGAHGGRCIDGQCLGEAELPVVVALGTLWGDSVTGLFVSRVDVAADGTLEHQGFNLPLPEEATWSVSDDQHIVLTRTVEEQSTHRQTLLGAVDVRGQLTAWWSYVGLLHPALTRADAEQVWMSVREAEHLAHHQLTFDSPEVSEAEWTLPMAGEVPVVSQLLTDHRVSWLNAEGELWTALWSGEPVRVGQWGRPAEGTQLTMVSGLAAWMTEGEAAGEYRLQLVDLEGARGAMMLSEIFSRPELRHFGDNIHWLSYWHDDQKWVRHLDSDWPGAPQPVPTRSPLSFFEDGSGAVYVEDGRLMWLPLADGVVGAPQLVREEVDGLPIDRPLLIDDESGTVVLSIGDRRYAQVPTVPDSPAAVRDLPEGPGLSDHPRQICAIDRARGEIWFASQTEYMPVAMYEIVRQPLDGRPATSTIVTGPTRNYDDISLSVSCRVTPSGGLWLRYSAWVRGDQGQALVRSTPGGPKVLHDNVNRVRVPAAGALNGHQWSSGVVFMGDEVLAATESGAIVGYDLSPEGRGRDWATRQRQPIIAIAPVTNGRLLVVRSSSISLVEPPEEGPSAPQQLGSTPDAGPHQMLVALDPERRRAAWVGESDGVRGLKIVDLETGQVTPVEHDPHVSVEVLAVLPDGRVLANAAANLAFNLHLHIVDANDETPSYAPRGDEMHRARFAGVVGTRGFYMRPEGTLMAVSFAPGEEAQPHEVVADGLPVEDLEEETYLKWSGDRWVYGVGTEAGFQAWGEVSHETGLWHPWPQPMALTDMVLTGDHALVARAEGEPAGEDVGEAPEPRLTREPDVHALPLDGGPARQLTPTDGRGAYPVAVYGDWVVIEHPMGLGQGLSLVPLDPTGAIVPPLPLLWLENGDVQLMGVVD